jgi:AbrB family looped-hinge helix DNA binding protein
MMAMPMTGKIASKGQTTPPKEIRDKLRVHSGDTLVYQVEGNAIRIRAGGTIRRSPESR